MLFTILVYPWLSFYISLKRQETEINIYFCNLPILISVYRNWDYVKAVFLLLPTWVPSSCLDTYSQCCLFKSRKSSRDFSSKSSRCKLEVSWLYLEEDALFSSEDICISDNVIKVLLH